MSFSHVSNPTQLSTHKFESTQFAYLPLPPHTVCTTSPPFRSISFRLVSLFASLSLLLLLLLLPPSFCLFFSAFFSVTCFVARPARLDCGSSWLCGAPAPTPPPAPAPSPTPPLRHRRRIPLSHLSHIQLQSVYASMTFSIMHFAHFNVDKGSTPPLPSPRPSDPLCPRLCACSASLGCVLPLF